MKETINSLIITFFVSFLIFTYSFAGPIPDTGQTKCYNSYAEIACPIEGEAFYGQDAHYNINPQSYTKLDANGNDLPDDAESWVMVRDNVTGLIWEVKTDDGSVHDKSNKFSWYDSNPETNGGNAGTPGDGTDTEDFINALNSINFGGFSDWRLPTVKELKAIVNSNGYFPSIDLMYFPEAIPSSYMYWSSTSYADNSASALGVYFTFGHINYKTKSSWQYVRAVRGRQSSSFAYVDNGDGTVTDPSTGLMWQQINYTTMTWEAALSYCESLPLAGYSDWRLPNDKELQSIVNYNKWGPSIDSIIFPGGGGDHWSSTSFQSDNSSSAWLLFFNSGILGLSSKNNEFAVRAVRGGQSQSLDHLVILAPYQAATWDKETNQIISWDTKEIPGNVKISLSREGGKDGTYETIVASTPNDGGFEWTVSGAESVNCMLKIDPLEAGYEDKGTTQGLFSIIQKEYKKGDVNGDGDVNLADAILALKINAGKAIEGQNVTKVADVDGDGKIGLAEVVYVLEKVAMMR